MILNSTQTLTNQNISSALLIATYTPSAAKKVQARVFADQVAGNGVYEIYATIQRAGAGSAYRVAPTTTPLIASGVTAICMISQFIPLSASDVLKIYIDGLAGDTTTPDIIVEIWEDNTQLLGAGSTSTTVTVDDGTNPLDSVDVWITTDSGGSNVVARGYTNASGQVSFLLDTGSYYVWKQISGYAFTNPETLTV